MQKLSFLFFITCVLIANGARAEDNALQQISVELQSTKATLLTLLHNNPLEKSVENTRFKSLGIPNTYKSAATLSDKLKSCPASKELITYAAELKNSEDSLIFLKGKANMLMATGKNANQVVTDVDALLADLHSVMSATQTCQNNTAAIDEDVLNAVAAHHEGDVEKCVHCLDSANATADKNKTAIEQQKAVALAIRNKPAITANDQLAYLQENFGMVTLKNGLSIRSDNNNMSMGPGRYSWADLYNRLAPPLMMNAEIVADIVVTDKVLGPRTISVGEFKQLLNFNGDKNDNPNQSYNAYVQYYQQQYKDQGNAGFLGK